MHGSRSTDPVPPQVQALVSEARAAERLGAYGLARELYQQGLPILSEPAHAPMAATLLRWAGNTHRVEGDGEAAMDAYIASLAVAELNRDPLNMAHACNCMASIHQAWGRLDEAADLFGQARELAERVQDHRLLAMLDQNIGVIANIRGDLGGALTCYQRSLDRYRKLDDRANLCQILNNLGMIFMHLRKWEDAEARFAEAATLAEAVGDLMVRILIEGNRTELHLARGDLYRARESCDIAFELASRVGQRAGLGEIHKLYGMIFREMRKYSLAEMHLNEAAALAEQFSSALLAGEVQRELAKVYRALDRNPEALRALLAAHGTFRSLKATRDLAEINQRLTELEEIFLQVVRKWGASIESKDHYTAGHCERVADYACSLARAVGFDEQTLTWFRMGALLHDVGKTVVPAEILNKQGPLTADEWEVMKRHTVLGADLLASVAFPWDIRPMVRNHHERYDGTGYPDGLAGDAIPLSARILCIADVFDALTTTRSYRPAYPVGEALKIMEVDANRAFDPELFGVFRELLRVILPD